MKQLDSGALCTLDQLRDFYNLHGINIDVDDLLVELINRVSAIFQTLTNCNFKSATYIEYSDGDGNTIFPMHLPIISITSIYDDPEWKWGESTLIDSDDYMVNSNMILLKNCVSTGENNIKLTLVAGYNTIPKDLTHACITESIILHKRKDTLGILNVTDLAGNTSFYQKGFLPVTTDILNHYKCLHVG